MPLSRGAISLGDRRVALYADIILRGCKRSGPHHFTPLLPAEDRPDIQHKSGYALDFPYEVAEPPRFDITSAVVDDPRSAERALWEGVR